jgi:7-cyano-7-deazaguanine synthase
LEKRNAICMVSGGVDSVTTAYFVNKRIKPQKQLLIFCDYGQRTYEYEKFCIRKIASLLKIPLKIVDLQWLGEISSSLLTKKVPIPETRVEDLWDPEKAKRRILLWWDPCRNSILLLVGLAHAEFFYISRNERYDVYIGIRRETPVMMKDNTPEFLKEVNRLAEHATHHGGYRILAPMIEQDKDDVVKLGEELGVPWQYTYSCYAGAGFTKREGEKVPVHCGRCSNCRRRHLAFRDAGVEDQTVYREKPAG